MYLHLYVPDADTVFNRAANAGAHIDAPIQNMFWGDRYGKLTDPLDSNGVLRTLRKISHVRICRDANRSFSLKPPLAGVKVD